MMGVTMRGRKQELRCRAQETLALVRVGNSLMAK